MPKRGQEAKSEWITIERPGYFGSRRNKILKKYDKQYGNSNYRIYWIINGNVASLQAALMLYEDAYYQFLKKNKTILRQLIESASDVYDNSKTNLGSGLDYSAQENHSNHYQDIAVRRVVLRSGQQFRGKSLIQIRHSASTRIGRLLSPGRVPFHLPNLIVHPVQRGWWEKGTVEEFWQSNKILQVRKELLRK